MNIILFVTNIAFSFYITLCYAQKHKTKENFPRSSALYYLLSVLCYLCSVICYLYSKALPASLVLRRGRIDNVRFSRPTRCDLRRTARDLSLRTLSIARSSRRVAKAYSAFSTLRRGRIDKDKLSQPARHHILRCCVRPFAVVLVDSFW